MADFQSPEISTGDIGKLYEKLYGIDVSRFFSGEKTSLDQVGPHNYLKFSDAVSGDSAFYDALMAGRGYSGSDKAEFVKAAEWVPEDSSILDIGCGPGRFSRYCKGHYKGIELNPGAVEEAKREGRNVHLEALADQSAGSFDVVAMFQVLEHVDDPEGFVAEAVRCVAPNGRIIISTPDLEGPMGNAVNTELNYPPHHLSWWSSQSIIAILKSHGFTPVLIWREPLQREHFALFFFSLLHPLRDKFIDFSLRAKITHFVARVIKNLVPKSLKECRYVCGHTIMVVADRLPADAD